MDAEVHWYAAEAVIWIAYREARPLTAEDEEAPAVLAAQRDLVTAVEAGRLRAEGVRCDGFNRIMGDAMPEAIPPRVFATRDSRSTDRHEGNLARTITLDSQVAPPRVDGYTALEDILQPRGVFYRDVYFLAADIRALWPSPAPVEAPLKNEAASPRPVPKAAPRKSEPSDKPVYSENACRAWFKIRTTQWPKDRPAPTAPACLAAARAHFSGDIARDAFRRIRETCVPEKWQKSGPRGPRE